MVMDIWHPRLLRHGRPFTALDEMERFLESDWPYPVVWRRTPADGMAFAPALCAYEKEDTYVVRAELAGIKAEDIDISLSGDTLTIKGERKAPEDFKDEEAQCCETCFGSFSRSVTFSDMVDEDKIEATLEDGILEVRLAKSPEMKPAKIEIKKKTVKVK